MKKQKSHSYSRVPWIEGGFVLFLALNFFYQWYAWTILNAIRVSIPPRMALTTAALFLVSSIALLMLGFVKSAISRVLGVLVAVSALLDFTDSIVDRGFDLDLFISHVVYHDFQQHFQRLSPNSAICFVLTGIAIFSLARKRTAKLPPLIANVLGAAICGIGVSSAFGYLSNIPALYKWKSFIPMSVYSAIMFAVMGLGIARSAMNWTTLRQRRVHTPLFIGLLILAMTAQLYQAQSTAERRSVSENTDEHANEMRNQMQFLLEFYANATHRIGTRWSLQNRTSRYVWEGDIAEGMRMLPGFTKICWVNDNATTQWCMPKNEDIKIEKDLLHEADTSLDHIRFETLPLKDSQFVSVMRVQQNSRSDGAIVGAISLQPIFNHYFDFTHFSIALLGTHNELLFRTDDGASSNEYTKILHFNYRGEDLNLMITPMPDQIAKFQTRIPALVIVIGILLALAMGYASFLFVELRESAKRDRERLAWEQAIAQGSDLIFTTTDLRGIIRSCNPAAEKFYGYSAEELVGRESPFIWHDLHQVEAYAREMSAKLGRHLSVFEAFTEKARHGAVDRNEWTYHPKGGKPLIGELSVHGIRDTKGSVVGFAGIVRDVTQQREAESKLIQSSKMASLGEMASGVAHEINNPLTIVQGRATRLLQIIDSQSKMDAHAVNEHVIGILEMCKRISKIVKGLALFSRNAELDSMEPADIREILEDTLEFCRERFENASVKLQIEAPEEMLLMCRPTQVSQVFLNLLNNAFDAVKELSTKWVRVAIAERKGHIEVRITDSGNGIDENIADRILEPFFTTKGVGKGTGLGLSISKGIVESHGGLLYLDRIATNTSFVVRFPAI